MPDDPTRLVLVRHGQSVATVERFAGGEQGCRGLSELGRRQCQALARRVAASAELAAATVVVSSTMARAVETAAPLAAALGLGVTKVRDVCEMHPGAGDGLTWEELERRFGSFDLGAEPDRPLAPGAESWRGFARRARGALLALATAHRGTTVVVATHGGVIEQSMYLGFGHGDATPPGRGLAMVRNTSMTEWSIGDGGWELVRFNDAGHLDADGEPLGT